MQGEHFQAWVELVDVKLHVFLWRPKGPTNPSEMIDRSFRIDFETFKKGWLNMFEGKSEDAFQGQLEAREGEAKIGFSRSVPL